MSLLNDLRSAAASLDQQFQVTSNEIPGILSALVYHLEHPDDFLKAAEDGGVEAVTELLAPTPPQRDESATPPTDPTAPSSPAAPLTDQELHAQIADLEAQLASRQATEQKTTVTHETGADPTAPSSPGDAG